MPRTRSVAGSSSSPSCHTAPRRPPKRANNARPYTLVAKPIGEFGCLTVTVDLSTTQGHHTITFNDTTNTKTHDTVHLDLKTGKILKH